MCFCCENTRKSQAGEGKRNGQSPVKKVWGQGKSTGIVRKKYQKNIKKIDKILYYFIFISYLYT